MNHPHTPAGHFSLSTTCSHCDRLVHRAAHVVHFFICFVVMLGAYQLGFNAPRKPAQPVVYAGPATIRNAGMTAVSAAIMENRFVANNGFFTQIPACTPERVGMITQRVKADVVSVCLCTAYEYTYATVALGEGDCT